MGLPPGAPSNPQAQKALDQRAMAMVLAHDGSHREHLEMPDGGWIYVIGEVGPTAGAAVKIGMSGAKSVKARLKDFTTGNPRPLVVHAEKQYPHARWVEYQLHHRLAPLHAEPEGGSEWFVLPSSVTPDGWHAVLDAVLAGEYPGGLEDPSPEPIPGHALLHVHGVPRHLAPVCSCGWVGPVGHVYLALATIRAHFELALGAAEIDHPAVSGGHTASVQMSVDLDTARSRIRGCLLGGAVGDALGAPVEFDSLTDIRAAHGFDGVTGYLPAYGRAGGAITDDTQMTLFTAEGTIRALIRARHHGVCHAPSVMHGAYLRWLVTQGYAWPAEIPEGGATSGWLVDVEGLHTRRAPGNTCVGALRTGRMGTVEQPINDSKGCGGVMRVAPIGFAAGTDPFEFAAECAAITHGHPSGYLSAGALAALIGELVRGAELDDALDGATDQLRAQRGHEETLAALDRGRALAAHGRPAPEQLESLGGGWVGEEALALAVCCALVAEDVRDGLLLAVNHSGDTDSVGSITGNILGALHGVEAVPADLLDGLELADVITTVADDLADAFYGRGVGGEYEPHDSHIERLLERYPGY